MRFRRPKRSNRILRMILPPVLAVLLALTVSAVWRTRSCDTGRFDPQLALVHARYLASSGLEGRAAGSGGNRAAEDYLAAEMERIGLLPAPGRESYRQPFRVVTPQMDTEPVFQVFDDRGRVAEELRMYSDYRLLPSGRGRGIDFRGELVLAGHNLNRLGPRELAGRLVLIDSVIVTQKKIDAAFDKGCEGIIFAAAKDWSVGRRRADQSVKLLNATGKTGADLMVGTIGVDAYQKLLSMVDTEELFSRSYPYAVIPDIRLTASIGFPVSETANLVGYIPGRDRSRTLILSASLDGLGPGERGDWFPGAANGAAPAGVLLETARILSEQKSPPTTTIAFIAWNANVQDCAGMRRYLSDPAFPLSGSTMMHMDVLGTSDAVHVTRIASGGGAGEVLGNKLLRYAGSIGVPAGTSFIQESGPVDPFMQTGIPSVVLSTFEPRANDREDTPGTLTVADIEPAADILLQYIKRDIYGDVAVDFLSVGWRWILILILVLAFISWLISASYRVYPNGGIPGLTTESLFYHPVSDLLRRTTAFILTFGIALFLIVLVVNLPRNGTIMRTDAGLITNQSIYLSVKETLQTIGDFVSFDELGRSRRQDLAEALVPAWLRTLALSAVSLSLALAGGGLLGIREAFGSRRLSPLRTAGSLAAASVPDVAVALAGIWFFLTVARISPDLSAALALKQFTVPAVALALLPGAYVARITSVTVRRELDREYIILAAAKGLTRRQILVHELRPAILIGIIDTIPSMAAMMLTNLIIIEYMFDYKGIVNYLLLFHTLGDAGAFVIGALAAGGIYGLYAAFGRLLALAVSPERRNRP